MRIEKNEVVSAKIFNGEHTKIINSHYNVKLKPIKVAPFIWHLSPKSNRQTILKHGLLPLKKTLVDNQFTYLLFANNFSNEITNMYPIASLVYDSFFYIESPKTESDEKRVIRAFEKEYCSRYDFWRINTKIVSNEWFVDPHLELEVSVANIGTGNSKSYVCTKQKIDPEALELFEYNGRFSGEVVIRKHNGSTNIAFKELPLKKIT